MAGAPLAAIASAEQVFDVATAAALAAHRHRGLAAGQDDRRLAGAPGRGRAPAAHAARPARAPRLRDCRPASRPRRPRGAPATPPPRASAWASRPRPSRRAPAADRRASASPRSCRRRPLRDARAPPAADRSGTWPAPPARRRRSCGSATVGPEPITPGSSLGTSEISHDSTRAGCAAIASRPPLMAERCFRTVFISPMWAPDFSSARLTSCLSASVRPGAGRASRAEAPPEIRQSTQIVGRQALHLFEDAAGGGAALLVGHGMGRLDDLDALAGLAVAVARDDQSFERMRASAPRRRAPWRRSPCRRRSRRFALSAAAACRYRARGRWRGGRRRGRRRTGRAAGRGRRHLSFASSSHYRGAMQHCSGPAIRRRFPFTTRTGKAPLLLLCDHASKAVPKALGDLGITDAELSRHVGWDIGGLDAAIELSKRSTRRSSRRATRAW